MKSKRPIDPAIASPEVVPVQDFEEIVHLIELARLKASHSVNTVLIDLYWSVGEYISHKIEADGWGKGTVESLSIFIQKKQPGIRGFSPQNLWRMRQFFEIYRGSAKLSTLLRELPWSSHLHLLSREKKSDGTMRPELPSVTEKRVLTEANEGSEGGLLTTKYSSHSKSRSPVRSSAFMRSQAHGSAGVSPASCSPSTINNVD
jgi:predicted nuclease of restriction endonuclease-like (RecB) superfamily